MNKLWCLIFSVVVFSAAAMEEVSSNRSLVVLPQTVRFKLDDGTIKTWQQGTVLKIDKNAISSAALTGNLKLLHHLHALGILDVNSVDDEGCAPLIYAAMKGHSALAEWLISVGADVNFQGTMLYEIPLSECKKAECARALIRGGADLNMQDPFGFTPLMMASHFERYDVAAELINAGAKLNLKDADGCTILMNAARQGKLELLNLLIKSGAAVDISNANPRSSKAGYCVDSCGG
jgi:ankyrin repeat protein